MLCRLEPEINENECENADPDLLFVCLFTFEDQGDLLYPQELCRNLNVIFF